MIKRAVLYCRLSKEDIGKNKDENSESIKNQKRLLEEYAVQHKFDVVDCYTDDDYSGLYEDRPEFERLIQDAYLRRFDIVIAKSQSRFTRNNQHYDKYVEEEFKKLNIRFIGVTDCIDTAIEENKKQRQIMGMTNEWYCEDISKSIRSVFKSKIADGKFIGSFAPFGYKKDPMDKNKLIIDEQPADIVRMIFGWYLEGYGGNQICHKLKEKGIPTPALYKKEQGLSYKFKQNYNYSDYGIWSNTTIDRILSNEVYIGHMIQHKSEKESYKSKRIRSIPKEQQVKVEFNHEPIISNDAFFKVQELRKRKRRAGNRDSNQKARLFSGKLFCMDCGNPLIASGAKKIKNQESRYYYRCNLAKKSNNQLCTSHSIAEDLIEEIVLDKINELISLAIKNPDSLQKIIYGVQNIDEINKRISLLNKEIQKLKSKVSEMDLIFMSLYQDKVNKKITEEMFRRLSDRNVDEVSENEKLIAKKEKELLDLEKSLAIKTDYVKLVHKYSKLDKLTNETVSDFIQFIKVSEKDSTGKKELNIYWYL